MNLKKKEMILNVRAQAKIWKMVQGYFREQSGKERKKRKIQIGVFTPDNERYEMWDFWRSE